jgi:hypothetical protein
MVRKGAGVLTKPLFAVVALAIVIIALIFVYGKISSLNTNPCWKETVAGLEPLKLGTSTPPTLSFNKECLKKFVITSSKGVCNMECRNIDDADQQRDCLKKCSYGKEGDAFTFIIAVPDDKGFFGRAGAAIAQRDFFWVFTGKTEVFVFGCQAGSVDALITECSKDGSPWECTPGSAVTSYKLAIDRSQKVCDVKVKTS